MAQERLAVLRASLGVNACTDEDTVVPDVHCEALDSQPQQRRVSAGDAAPGFAPPAVRDLLHLLLHSLDQLCCAQSAADQHSLEDEISAARCTVNTLLSEVEASAAPNLPAALPEQSAKNTQTVQAQLEHTGTAPDAPAAVTSEHATQTKGHDQPPQTARGAQTHAAVPDSGRVELEQQCRRADKWKARCRQTQQELAAAQSAAAEGTILHRNRKASSEATPNDEASARLDPRSAVPTNADEHGSGQQIYPSTTQQSQAVCAEQLQAAVSGKASLAAANADLRSAISAQRSDADAELCMLKEQLAKAEAGQQQAAHETAAAQNSLEAVNKQLAALEASAQAEKEQHAATDAQLRAEREQTSGLEATLAAEQDKVIALEVCICAEKEKLDRARVAVLDTVDKLRKVAEGAGHQAQLQALQERNTALETALHETRRKLEQRRSQTRAAQESHAQAVAMLQASADAADATISELRTQCAEAVSSRKQVQQQQESTAAEIKQLRDLFEEAASRHEHTVRELHAARDALVGAVSAVNCAIGQDGCCGQPGETHGSTVAELAQFADHAVAKLTKRCSALDAMLHLVESDRDRAVSQALTVNETAQLAAEQNQTARASEAAALAACEALQASIVELRKQHELECLALGERHVADMRSLEAAMVDSRAALKQQEAEDAADALGQSQAAAEAAHADELAACRAQHVLQLQTLATQHAADLEGLKRLLAAAASASDAVREHFTRYQAQKAHEVADLERRLRVAMLLQQHMTPTVGSKAPVGGKRLAGQMRRSMQSTAGKRTKAAKPARRQPLVSTDPVSRNSSRPQCPQAPEPAPPEASSEHNNDDTARLILAAIESDATAAAVREADIQRVQSEAAEVALAQAMSAADALRERVRGLQHELAACKGRAADAEASASAARARESSARQTISQLQVLALCACER